MKVQFRCSQCNKLLGEGIYTMLKIKCQRCKHMNNLRAIEHQKPTESHRAPEQKGAQHDPSKSQYTAG